MVTNHVLPEINIRDLYDHSVHLGHKTFKWNPEMAPYIYSVKNNTHVIDLQKTQFLLKKALLKIYDTIKQNQKILFVGSKIYIAPIIAEQAEKSGQFYINHRWLGGILTNWKTVSASIKKLHKLESILEGKKLYEKYTKKEILSLSRTRDKLSRAFNGIKNLEGLPNLIIIFDTIKDHIAIKEAWKLGIPIIAILDTNSNPQMINFPIPGNDDSISSITYFCKQFVQTIVNSIKQSLVDSGVDINENLVEKITDEKNDKN